MIVIYGASGLTGSLIAQAVKQQGLDFAMAGRDLGRLELAAQSGQGALTTDLRVAAVHDLEALARIFEDADVVINCAGPFSVIGEPVVRAALAADSHYLDITGEQDFVRKIYERFESAARQSKRVIVNACAFEVALGDWAGHLAAEALEGQVADSITVSYAIERLHATKGTQLSILDAMGKPGYRWERDRWIRTAPGAERLDVSYPEPFGTRTALSFPSPEVITLPRHAPANRVQCFMSLGQDTPLTRAAGMIAPVVAPVMTPLLGSILRSSLGAIAQSAIADTDVQVDPGRTSQFAIVAEARTGAQSARCVVAGEDIYAVSAGIACLAAERLQNEGELSGVLAPSELLAPRDALEEIAEQHALELELP